MKDKLKLVQQSHDGKVDLRETRLHRVCIYHCDEKQVFVTLPILCLTLTYNDNDYMGMLTQIKKCVIMQL